MPHTISDLRESARFDPEGDTSFFIFCTIVRLVTLGFLSCITVGACWNIVTHFTTTMIVIVSSVALILLIYFLGPDDDDWSNRSIASALLVVLTLASLLVVLTVSSISIILHSWSAFGTWVALTVAYPAYCRIIRPVMRLCIDLPEALAGR